MIDNKKNADEQLKRMKSLMNYGINENKQSAYSGVEYTKKGADGKLYGIVREGTKFYIKVGKNPEETLLAENFEYIGGFRNRKDNMFESFAAAQRYFVEKMMAINEGVDNAMDRVIAESWDLDEKKEVIAEATDKMKAEIQRQREIMRNCQRINESKPCDMLDGCAKPKEIKVEEVPSKPGAPFTEEPAQTGVVGNEKPNIKGKQKPVVGNKATNESTETPLSSRKNPDYMDTTHGTKIGNNAPFVDKVDGTDDAVADDNGGEMETQTMEEHVNEECAMHDAQSQNCPKPGVGEKGDNEPFEEKVEITEDVEDLDTELEDDEVIEDDDLEDDGEVEDDEIVDDTEVDVDDDEVDVDVDDDDTNARLDALEQKLDKILDALNNLEYDDDDTLYDDDEEGDGEEEDEFEVDIDDEEGPVEDDEEEEYEVIESKSYKALMKRMNEEEDYFGKHPAYQKKVMTTPANTDDFKEGFYDMNDDSVKSDAPYGTKKGSQAPFDEPIRKKIEDAVVENVMKMIKKKSA